MIAEMIFLVGGRVSSLRFFVVAEEEVVLAPDMHLRERPVWHRQVGGIQEKDPWMVGFQVPQ